MVWMKEIFILVMENLHKIKQLEFPFMEDPEWKIYTKCKWEVGNVEWNPDEGKWFIRTKCINCGRKMFFEFGSLKTKKDDKLKNILKEITKGFC